jgi:hypothetical protein
MQKRKRPQYGLLPRLMEPWVTYRDALHNTINRNSENTNDSSNWTYNHACRYRTTIDWSSLSSPPSFGRVLVSLLAQSSNRIMPFVHASKSLSRKINKTNSLTKDRYCDNTELTSKEQLTLWTNLTSRKFKRKTDTLIYEDKLLKACNKTS